MGDASSYLARYNPGSQVTSGRRRKVRKTRRVAGPSAGTSKRAAVASSLVSPKAKALGNRIER